MDTIVAAEQMAQKNCAVVLVLGGDGTNRGFCSRLARRDLGFVVNRDE